MKLKATTQNFISPTRVIIAGFIAAVLAVGGFLYVSHNASANNYAERIKALEQDINEYDAEAKRLAGESDSLRRELARLSNERATIQAQINISQEKVNQLQQGIKENEQKIAQNRDSLGVILADLYVSDTVTPIEMLASSKGVSDYIDKQEYRASARDRLTSTIATIKEAKAELERQKKTAEATLKDQEAQRNLLASKEAEQQTLIQITQNDENNYKKLSKEALAKKEQLQREQQRAIDAATGGAKPVAGDPNKGGYPAKYANSNYYAPIVDDWGMYSRQCVSYTAWKAYQAYTLGLTTHNMPWWGGDRYVTINGQRVFTSGHAKYWPTSARAAGIPVGTTPRKNSVGVITSGQYGHVVWVEDVNSNGTINVSQYNAWIPAGWGHYSEVYNVSPSAYDYYIYF